MFRYTRVCKQKSEHANSFSVFFYVKYSRKVSPFRIDLVCGLRVFDPSSLGLHSQHTLALFSHSKNIKHKNKYLFAAYSAVRQ